jgi:hypothetical protein
MITSNLHPMTNPITPPQELVQEWWEESNHRQYTGSEAEEYVVSMTAQWGADQELEACCEWFTNKFGLEVAADIADLRAARRPKPPSLKEQAFKILNPEKEGVLCGTFEYRVSTSEAATIRRALEALPDD